MPATKPTRAAPGRGQGGHPAKGGRNLWMDFRSPWWRISLCVALLVFFAALYCFPVTDPDYFWHVTTGRWIVQHRSLPAADPFKYTYERIVPGSPEAAVVTCYLRCYWLADLVMYAVDALAGVTGMIFLRVATYVAILGLMLRWLEARKAGAMGFIWGCLLALQMATVPSERPQLFALLLFPILMKLLDELGGATGRKVTVYGLAICLLMLLWANMHGSFVLGVIVIVAAAAGMLLDGRMGRQHVDPRVYGWLAAACLLTLANPNGAGIMLEAVRSRGGRSNNIAELASTMAHFQAKWKSDIGYWGVLVLAITTLVTQGRRMKAQHLTVAVGMLVMSLMARRHMLYLPLAGLAIVPYLGNRLPWGRAGCLCAAATLAIAVWCADKYAILMFGQDDAFPVAAVEFLQGNPTADNLFNFYDWGGYIPYKMPGTKVFIDGRSVVAETAEDFAAMMETPRWGRLFETYGIATVIMPAADSFSGELFPLATSLIASPEWVLVYADAAAVVFVKNIPPNQSVIDRHRKSADDFCKHILQFTDRYRPRWRKSKFFYGTRGIAFANMKRWREAIDCLKRAVAMEGPGGGAADALQQVIERARLETGEKPAQQPAQ